MRQTCERLTTSILPALLGAILLVTASAATAASLSLPTTTDPNDILRSGLRPSDKPRFRIEYGAHAFGANNVGSIWEMDKDDQPARTFDDDTAYATLHIAQWIKLSHREWWVGYGRGRRSAYEGNADAGQLWIDMHADGQTLPRYLPVAGNTELTASWYEIGRDFPVRIGKASGTGSISVKRLFGEDLLSRAVVGEVEGDMFTAMIRTVASDTDQGDVVGSGWSMDSRVTLRYTDRWVGQFAIEGILGSMSWKGLQIEDARVISPRTFTDPDGFLHDIGGISGALWYEDRTIRINPRYRVDLVRMGNPNLMLACEWQSGAQTMPSIGAAWPQSRSWMPYTRYYPSQGRLEIGAVGRDWQIRISGDDWISASPRTAEVGISASAVRF